MESGCLDFLGVLLFCFHYCHFCFNIIFLNVNCYKFALKCGWAMISQSLGITVGGVTGFAKYLGKCASSLFSHS